VLRASSIRRTVKGIKRNPNKALVALLAVAVIVDAADLLISAGGLAQRAFYGIKSMSYRRKNRHRNKDWFKETHAK
jgi:hypothetical protein